MLRPQKGNERFYWTDDNHEQTVLKNDCLLGKQTKSSILWKKNKRNEK